MDTLTHGIIGALSARCCNNAKVNQTYFFVAALAAVFPDLDYLLFWINPYAFITDWHRGLSHSLVMLPVWALLLSALMYPFFKAEIPFRTLFGLCALGLATHLTFDYLTLYGIKLFSPLSERRYALSWLFDLDPWLGLLAGLSLLAGLYSRRCAVIGVLTVGIYLGLCGVYQQRALLILENRVANETTAVKLHVLPQAFFPLHWKLLVEREDHYEQALVTFNPGATQYIANVIKKIASATSGTLTSVAMETTAMANPTTDNAGPFTTHFNAYRAIDQLQWRAINKYGNNENQTALARAVWHQDAFSGFRHFAAVPVAYRIDHDASSQCVWFTDLRYVIPFFKPPFRYGMCRINNKTPWQIYRLRRGSDNTRQLIE